MKNKKSIINSNQNGVPKRDVDVLATNVHSFWRDSFVFIKKTTIKTKTGVWILIFLSGFTAAFAWTVSLNMQTLSQAEGEMASLALMIESDEVEKGSMFNVDIILDTNKRDVVAARTVIDYDSQYFELQGYDTANSIFHLNNTCAYNGKPCEIINSNPQAGIISLTFAKPAPGVKADSGLLATLTFKALADVTPKNRNISLFFNATNDYTDSDVIINDGRGTDILNQVSGLAVTVFTPDTISPKLKEVTPILDPTNDPTPNYTFNSNEAGTIAYSGSCSSETTQVSIGDNVITFNNLEDGTYNDCGLTVTDSNGNASEMLLITQFTITSVLSDEEAPVLVEVSPVSNPTNDPTPNYTFNSNEAGTIAYSGSCSSETTQASVGDNVIKFNSLEDGTYDDCGLTVTDGDGNVSDVLNVKTFKIDIDTGNDDSKEPTIHNEKTDIIIAAGATSTEISFKTDENAICKFSVQPNKPFENMESSFTTTDGKNHNAKVEGLADGKNFQYYAKCRDEINNANKTDHVVKVTVGKKSEDVGKLIAKSGEIDRGKVEYKDLKLQVGEKSQKLVKTEKLFSNDEKMKFKGEISGADNVKVEIYKNGKFKEDVKVNSKGEWKIDFKEKEEGTHTYKIVFKDENGDELESKKYQIKVDTKKPKFEDLPLTLTKKRGEKIWWVATDGKQSKDKGIDHYRYSFLGKYKNIEGASFNIPLDAPRGPHDLTVTAYDDAGNKETRHVIVWIK